ncbi:MAG: phage integrase Arm DNA-binding domain-containing protein [Terriglobia bacterium]|nr:phage integrase Arm DNA-binding domain-containing protein [Terriglobia bacterium]
MSPRRRSERKRHWPKHLYERDGYYSWRNPLTREEFGIGRDKASAFEQAMEANRHIIGLTHKPRLIHRLTGDANRSIEAWNIKYQALIAKQDYAAATLRGYKSLGNRLVTMLGANVPVGSIKALAVSEMLESVVAEGKARLAQALRNFASGWFREARVAGWTEESPVMDTRLPVSVEVKRARLSFEDFIRIYESAMPWLKNAMALALVSGQRREDITEAQFKDFHDAGWWLIQSSDKGPNKHRIFIPLDLRLSVFGMSLGDVVAQCRRSGALSKHLVHQTVQRGNSPIGRKIWMDTLSKRFGDAVEALGNDWGEKTRPSFHEIRSLSERLYAAQGGINTQELLGHSSAAMTAMYHDGRGSVWTRIKTTV